MIHSNSHCESPLVGLVELFEIEGLHQVYDTGKCKEEDIEDDAVLKAENDPWEHEDVGDAEEYVQNSPEVVGFCAKHLLRIDPLHLFLMRLTGKDQCQDRERHIEKGEAH